jgi:hypothetical protein
MGVPGKDASIEKKDLQEEDFN